MDHIPDEEMPAVGKAAHAVVQEAVNAGAWVFGAGLESQRASIVAADATVTDGPYPETKEVIGGFAVINVPSREDALAWAAKIAVGGAAACRRYASSCPTPNKTRCSVRPTGDGDIPAGLSEGTRPPSRRSIRSRSESSGL